MQVMPSTAAEIGEFNLKTPKDAIEAGISHIKQIKQLYQDIPDSLERIKFTLATYNAGQGHIADARRLAEKHGKDPNIWTDHVDQYILLKSRKEYYSDPVVKYGFCRGEEPFNYVIDILKRYQVYSDLFKEETNDDAVALGED